MDIVSAILTAIIAGATAAVKDTASQAVKDAYAGLRRLLVGVHKLEAIKSLDADPKSPEAKNALVEELSKSAVLRDDRIVECIRDLTVALENESPARLAEWDISLGNVVGARNVVIKKLETRGSINIGDIEAKSGDAIVRNLRAGVARGKE